MKTRNFSRSIILVLVWALFAHFNLYSLERDYCYSGCMIDEDQDPDEWDENGHWCCYNSHKLCLNCFFAACTNYYWHPSINSFEQTLNISLIPSVGKERCFYCTDEARPIIYSGYLHFRHKKRYDLLRRQLIYTKKYPGYQAYWPETSPLAAKISDNAQRLFKDLVKSTALRRVGERKELYAEFITDSRYFNHINNILPIAMVSSCFRFSDYYRVINDLTGFSRTHFTKEECSLIEGKTSIILDSLCGMFLEMYADSLELHPTEEIQVEVNFIDILYGSANVLNSKIMVCDNLSGAKSGKVTVADTFRKYGDNYLETFCSIDAGGSLPSWLLSDFWLLQGTQCNDNFLHSDAISYLNAVIEKDPSNIEAYQERLHSYFEMGNLDLAIQDFTQVKKLEIASKALYTDLDTYTDRRDSYCDDQGDYVVNPPKKGMLDYASGFHAGVQMGGIVGGVEFVPTTWSCCKGILHGFWSLVWSPQQVSNELYNSSYEIVEFMWKSTAKESLEVVVPELRELLLEWETLSDYEKGRRTGYIIGKYGVDILAPGATIKWIKKYRRLKRLNSMATVECCIASEAEKAVILEKSAAHAALRAPVVGAAKVGKIIPRNANVMPHVMQNKHAWGNLVKITGNQKEDFKAVIKLLEKNEIVSNSSLKDSFHVPANDVKSPLRRLRYEKKIQGETVEAIFIKNVETEETLLINAWVNTQ